MEGFCMKDVEHAGMMLEMASKDLKALEGQALIGTVQALFDKVRAILEEENKLVQE